MPSSIFLEWDEKVINTPYGDAAIKTDGAFIFIQRHGTPSLPPHRINHRANIDALINMGAKMVLAVNSVGSLKKDIKPGTFLIPDDFISFQDVPTFFDEEMRFSVPLMDRTSADLLYKESLNAGMNVQQGGIYIQTRGPRLETRAEIELLRSYGDVIGMTMASEATLCIERKIPYASICSIDNFCNGIAEVPLSMDEIHSNSLTSLELIETLIKNIVSKERL